MQKIKPKKFLGVDYGMKRIGLALSDERKIIASPYMTLSAGRHLKDTANKFVQTIKEIEEKENILIETIVIGMPYKLSGKMSLMADEVQHFIDILKEITSIPIFAWDERLTTALAEKSLREADLNRKRRSKMIDTISASLVLQSFLDHQNRGNL
jgi:putative Holliday junction resolvase